MNETVEKVVRGYLNTRYMEYDKENDIWTNEEYPDAGDRLRNESIKQIFDSDNPVDKCISIIDDMYEYSDDERYDEYIQGIRAAWDIEERELQWDEIEDEVSDFVHEHVCMKHPYQHYLDIAIPVDILIDTGDGNSDFTYNCVYPHYNGTYGETLNDHAAILWLAMQQGYTKTQVNDALRNEEYGKSKFLKSLRNEVAECSSHMNAVSFFVSMTLGECIELYERIKKNAQGETAENVRYYPYKCKGRDYIVLKKETPCGLYDAWSGAGSTLDIVLEKDVKLPLKYIDSAMPDGCRGYAVSDIYGLCEKFWSSNMIVHEEKQNKNGGISL